MATPDYKTQIVERWGGGGRTGGGPALQWPARKTCAQCHEYNSLSNNKSII